MYIQEGFDEKYLQLIIEECPLAYEALGTFYANAAKRQLKSSEAQQIFLNIMETVGGEPQTALLRAHFRMLYDFFDSYSIHVYIGQHILEDPKNLYLKVMDSLHMMALFPEILEIGGYTGRVQAELSAFFAAFGHLQRRLKDPEIFARGKHLIF